MPDNFSKRIKGERQIGKNYPLIVKHPFPFLFILLAGYEVKSYNFK